MKHRFSSLLLILFDKSDGVAQDNPAAQRTAPAMTEAASADDAEPTAPLEALDWMVGA